MIKEIEDLKQIDHYPCAIKFGAEWCGPCKKMQPHFEELSERKGFKNIRFYSVDVDLCDSELQESYDVKSLPTLIVHTSSLSYQRISNIEELEKVLFTLI